MENNGPRLQSSLGEVTSVKTKKDRNWNMGYLAIGKVLRVHPKRYTADVQIYGDNDFAASTRDQEGRHSCWIGVGNAGYDDKFGASYGQISSIKAGTIVLVGFIRNLGDKPVIIKVFHNTEEELGEDNLKNNLDSKYQSATDGAMHSSVNVMPNQDFMHVDDDGDFEIASHTKSFIVGKERFMDDEYYDFENLSVKNKNRQAVTVEEKYSKPKKYMAVFRDNFADNVTNWLKLIIDSAKTSFRLAKLQQEANQSTYMELDQEGTFRLRRQLDTKAFGEATQYADLSMDKTGKTELMFTAQTPNGEVSTTTITVHSDGTGITVKTTDNIKVETDKDIDINCQNMRVNGGSSIKMNAPRIYLN